MNRFKVYIILHVILILGLNSCEVYRHSDKDKSIDVRVDLKKETILLKDSLLAAGVDSLFVFQKSCEHCLKQSIVYDSRKEKKGIAYSVKAFSTPVYVFWMHKGKYYVKKIDQFEVYPTIERAEELHFPLYDFWQKNYELLLSEQPIRQLTETIVRKNPYDKADTVIKIIPVYYYEPAENIETSRVPLTNRIRIGWYSKNTQFERTINENHYNPMVITKDVYLKMRKDNDGDSIVIGNDKGHYQLNRSMKIYTWSKLVESELFDIEMRQLWNFETGRRR